MTEERRTTQLHFMVTPSEASRARSQADARLMRLSAYLRRSAIRGDPGPPVMDARELRKAYAELRRVGTNLNQIARAINTYGASGATPKQVAASARAVERAAELVSSEIKAARNS